MVIRHKIHLCVLDAATMNTRDAQKSDSNWSVLLLTENVWMSFLGCRIERVEMRVVENGHCFSFFIVDVISLMQKISRAAAIVVIILY